MQTPSDSRSYLVVPPAPWGTKKRPFNSQDAPDNISSSPKRSCTPEDTFASKCPPASACHYDASSVNPAVKTGLPLSGVDSESTLPCRTLFGARTTSRSFNHHPGPVHSSASTQASQVSRLSQFEPQHDGTWGQMYDPVWESFVNADDGSDMRYNPNPAQYMETTETSMKNGDFVQDTTFPYLGDISLNQNHPENIAGDLVFTEPKMDTNMESTETERQHEIHSSPMAFLLDDTTSLEFPDNFVSSTGPIGYDIQQGIEVDKPCKPTPKFEGAVACNPTGGEHAPLGSKFNTCLGLVLVSDARYLNPKKLAKNHADSEVKVDVRGPLVILRDAESNAYIGTVGQETTALIRGIMKYEMRLSGKARPPGTLELLLYSQLNDAGPIGDYLSDSGWFLQEPDSYDRSTTYHNPHWLLRPGVEQVPSYQQELVGSKQAPELSTSELSEVTRLLDSATGPSTFKTAQISELLTTELKRYFNAVTKATRSAKPRLCLGGILADDMGLGKTLTALSLIVGSLFRDESGTLIKAPGPTLIAAPMSTLPNWENQIQKEEGVRLKTVATKSVVFSTWSSMLDLIGNGLAQSGILYQRLDGSRSLPQRRQALKDFRCSPDCQVLLATLGAAGVGVDLTMATRVHIVEPGWNPMLERQAVDRVHRLGQTKEVISTSYVVSGSDSVEEYIRRRQKWKFAMIAASLGSSNSTCQAPMEFLIQDLRETLGVALAH
ncbi:hypothetical protein N8I77_008412 [Diaporthe amygdali]|uniref:Helicase C-terminal domain-containing protein n=2 Tax=Phomopsis amygdali TaxID=1214568 RepID=A0AAD9SEY1_PHOAM|nr:hypothetical protein N8I77_008412 [Diaporthe amygdali]